MHTTHSRRAHMHSTSHACTHACTAIPVGSASAAPSLRVGFPPTVTKGTYPGWEAQGGWVQAGRGSRVAAAGAGQALLAWLAAWLQVAALGRGPTAAKRAREDWGLHAAQTGSGLDFLVVAAGCSHSAKTVSQGELDNRAAAVSAAAAATALPAPPRPAPPHPGPPGGVGVGGELEQAGRSRRASRTARTP